MSSHKILVPIEGSSDPNFVELTVDYDKGGMSYATYKMKPRGYYTYATTVTREEGPHCVSTKYRMFSGKGHLIEETKRLSPKRFKELVAQAEQNVATQSGPYWDLVQSVMPAPAESQNVGTSS